MADLLDTMAAPSTTRTQVVLDTSALIADPTGIFTSFEHSDLVIPLTVIEELDGIKKRLDSVGAAAREVLRALERYRADADGDLRTPTWVAGDTPTTVRIELNGVQVAHLHEHGLATDKPDNRIIGAALGLANTHDRVRVVSNDAALRVKAASLGLEAVEHVSHAAARMTDRPVGWTKVSVSPAAIDAVYAAIPDSELDEIAATVPVNHFAVLQAGSQSALVRRLADGGFSRPLPSETAWDLRPRNKEQQFALNLLLDPDVGIVCLDGPAGTGKTLLAVASGLEQVLNGDRYKRVCVYRPVIPVGKADLGFLPGGLDEKLDPWMAAITDAVYALTEERSEADARHVIDEAKARGQLTMESVAYLRGRTLHDAFIIVDEAQNLDPNTAKTLLTRVGEHSKIVFTGDTSQIDAAFLSESTNALSALVHAFSGQACFGQIRLTKGERSRIAELAATLL